PPKLAAHKLPCLSNITSVTAFVFVKDVHAEYGTGSRMGGDSIGVGGAGGCAEKTQAMVCTNSNTTSDMYQRL
ncbi:MAG: hypothetical protein SXV54_16845, partial [Chloroflexota bacterium]|nr:hypothetical protein [Chloroflexota bacterium]